jgi:hypothetical protein
LIPQDHRSSTPVADYAALQPVNPSLDLDASQLTTSDITEEDEVITFTISEQELEDFFQGKNGEWWK